MLAVTWWGTLPTWLTLIALGVLGYYFVRGSGGQALSVLETANRVLTQRLQALEEEKVRQAEMLAELQQRTDLEPLLATVAGEFAAHERRAQERHEVAMAIANGTVGAVTSVAATLTTLAERIQSEPRK